jgi:hypothetical protein
MDDELADPAVQARMAELDTSIREKIGDSISDEEVDPELAEVLPTVPDELLLEEDVEYGPFEHDAAMLEADDYTPDAYYKYLTVEVQLANMGGPTERGQLCDASETVTEIQLGGGAILTATTGYARVRS